MPTPGPALSIGTCSLGCLQGAATLPASGPRLRGDAPRAQPPLRPPEPDRVRAAAGRRPRGRRSWGWSSSAICRSRAAARRPADTAATRPGWTRTSATSRRPGVRAGHLSRRAREQLSPLAVIDLKTHEKTPAVDAGGREAARAGGRGSGGRPDLRQPGDQEAAVRGARPRRRRGRARLRPWWAHHDHFHVRLKCPADSPQCVPQEPPRRRRLRRDAGLVVQRRRRRRRARRRRRRRRPRRSRRCRRRARCWRRRSADGSAADPSPRPSPTLRFARFAGRGGKKQPYPASRGGSYCGTASADACAPATRQTALPTSSATSSAPRAVDRDADRPPVRVAVGAQEAGQHRRSAGPTACRP